MKLSFLLTLTICLASFHSLAQSDEEKDDKIDILQLEEEVVPPQSDDDEIYEFVETMPVMPGCINLSDDEKKSCTEREIIIHLSKNVTYPTDEEGQVREDVSGTVYVKFVINREGVVGSPQVMRGIDPVFDQAAVDGVMSLPKMIPGQQRGKNVNVSYMVPVRFVIN